MIRFFTTLLLAALLCQAEAMSPDERQRQLDSFDKVWQTIRDKHWQTQPGGLDWDAVRADLRPKAERAATANEIRDLIREMLKRLKQSHFHLIAAETMGALSDPYWGDGEPPFEAEIIGSDALVTRVEPDSPAKLGWKIVSIDGTGLGQRIRAIDAAYANSTERGLRLHQMMQARLSGQPGAKLAIEFLDGSDRKVSLKVPVEPARGKVAAFGNLPPTVVRIESKQLDSGKIGYVRFNLFLDPVRLMSTFSEAVRNCLKCEGFIVDVRGNPGGIGILATGIASWFVDQPNQRLGSMYTRDSTLNFVVNPRPQAFSGPLAVLIDESSASTSEIFAGGLKDLHRARIFGEKSAAAALPSIIERLPNGDGFQYAVANYISEGGRPLEGNGVQPDETVPMSRASLLAGHDAVIDAATKWILSTGSHQARSSGK